MEQDVQGEGEGSGLAHPVNRIMVTWLRRGACCARGGGRQTGVKGGGGGGLLEAPPFIPQCRQTVFNKNLIVRGSTHVSKRRRGVQSRSSRCTRWGLK